MDFEAAYNVLQSSNVVGLLFVSGEGKVLRANAAALRSLGASSVNELNSRSFKSEILCDGSSWTKWQDAAATGSKRDQEMHCRALDGHDVFLLGDIHRVRGPAEKGYSLFGVFIDITKSRQFSSALQRAARMEAVGSLTTGIAHDVNNLLTVLVGNLYLVAEGVRSDVTLFDKVKRARNAAKRGTDLTRQLLSFARGTQIDSSAVDVRKLISNLEPLLRHVTGSKIELSTKIEEELSPIDANAAQLESAVVNLTVNARDAIEGPGRIVIKASNVHVGPGEMRCDRLQPGNYVCISVTDDGCGIPDEVRESVFSPFFTTKKIDEGTGLGLSMVQWFCEQSGGAVVLESRSGYGTRVSLMLPRSARSTADTTIRTMPLAALPTGNEAVLVLAEDEEIKLMVQQILETLGYSVHLSAEPSDAIQLLDSVDSDLVLIDSDWNSKRNRIDASTLRERLGRSVKIIVLNDSESINNCGNSMRLAKPFTLLELATAVRRALDGQNHG